MENLVNMIEGILEKSNRIQQGFLDRIEANDLRLSRIEGRLDSIENGIKDLYANQSNVLSEIYSIQSEIENIYGRQIKLDSLVQYQADLKDNILSQLDGIADRQKLMSGLVENIEDMLIDLK